MLRQAEVLKTKKLRRPLNMNKKTLSKRVIILTTVATMMSTTAAFAQDINKDETVYVIMDDNGKVQQRIVSDWINSDKNLGEFKDQSDLQNIKNVKGDEEPETNGSKLTWNVDGTDLYYQGESDKELPIDVDIKYELNGKEVDPSQVKGQSGKFKITMKVKNNQSKTVEIDGVNRKVYVPFLVASEIIMPNNNFQQVKTDSGKVIADGNNSDITFISVPGLKESLQLADQLSDLKDEIVIEGETTDFEVPSVMMMATTGALDLKDLDENNTIDDLRGKLDKLSDAGEQLLSGTETLNNGQHELQSNYTQFNSAMGTLKDGATTLSNGISTLQGKVPTLQAGINSIDTNLGALASKQDEYTQGVQGFKQQFSAVVDQYSNLNDGIAKNLDGVKELKTKLADGAGGVQTLADSATTLGNIALGMKAEAKQYQENGDNATADALNKYAVMVEGVSNGQKTGISTLQGQLAKAVGGLGQLESGLTDASNGSKTLLGYDKALLGGTDSLIENSQKLAGATDQLHQGSSTLAGASGTLVSGINQLNAGGISLRDGSSTLAEKSNEVLAGINKLASGTDELYDGVSELKSDGLDMITDKGSSALKDVTGFMEVKDQMVKLAEDYGTYSGKTEAMNGKVKFIMRINNEDKTKKSEDKKTSEVTDENKTENVAQNNDGGLVHRILAFFNK